MKSSDRLLKGSVVVGPVPAVDLIWGRWKNQDGCVRRKKATYSQIIFTYKSESLFPTNKSLWLLKQ